MPRACRGLSHYFEGTFKTSVSFGLPAHPSIHFLFTYISAPPHAGKQKTTLYSVSCAIDTFSTGRCPDPPLVGEAGRDLMDPFSAAG